MTYSKETCFDTIKSIESSLLAGRSFDADYYKLSSWVKAGYCWREAGFLLYALTNYRERLISKKITSNQLEQSKKHCLNVLKIALLTSNL